MEDIIKKMGLENEEIYITRGVPYINFTFARTEDETFFDHFIKTFSLFLVIGLIIYLLLSSFFYVPLYYWLIIMTVSIIISFYTDRMIKKLIRNHPHTWFIVSDSRSIPHELAHIKLHKDFLLDKRGKVSNCLNAELDIEVEEYLKSLGFQDKMSLILKVIRFVCNMIKKDKHRPIQSDARHH